MRLSLEGVEFGGLPEQFDASSDASHPLVQEEDSPEEGFIRIRIDRAAPCEVSPFLRRQRNLNLGRNRARHLGLQIQYIGERTLIFPRPKMPVILRSDQLSSNPHFLPRVPDRS